MCKIDVIAEFSPLMLYARAFLLTMVKFMNVTYVDWHFGVFFHMDTYWYRQMPWNWFIECSYNSYDRASSNIW